MMRRRFRKNEGGRVPFALVAILILVGTTVLAVLVSRLDGGNGNVDEWSLTDEERGLKDLERGISDLAVEAATSAMEEGLDKGLGPEDISRVLGADLSKGFTGSMGKVMNSTGHRGWTVELVGSDLGIDIGSLPDGTVLGTVNWTAISPGGVTMRGVTQVSEGLERPFALAYTIKERLRSSGSENGELEELIKGMLFKLATVRTANGELEGKKVLTGKDVGKALDLALGLLMNSSSGGSGPYQKENPADLLLKEYNITTVKSSSVLAQYILGLLDYYLLWFRDYTGLGEASGSFFEWVGKRTDGDKNLSAARDRWYKDLKVRDLVERWAFDTMATLLRAVLKISGDEEIELQDLGMEELSGRVKDGVNTTAEAMEGAGVGPWGTSGLADGRPPIELAQAVEAMPCEDPEEKGPVLERLRQGLEGTAMHAIGGLLVAARGLANYAWDEILASDELEGFSAETPKALLDPVKEQANISRPKITYLDVYWDLLRFNATIGAKGVHDTAPEGRLRRALGAAMAPGKGRLLAEVRPYEADYHIEVKGSFMVHQFVFSRLDRLGLALGHVGVVINFLIPINLSLTIPVLTGVPLSGVDYGPSDTLYGDLKEALWEFVNRTWGAVRWAAGAMRGLFDDVVDGIKELGLRGLENLGNLSAASFSRIVEKVLKALYARAWNDAMNMTWRFLRELIGDDLREMLTFNVTILGLDIQVQLDVFAECLNLSYSADGLSFNLTIKRLTDENPPFRSMPIDGFSYAVLGIGRYQREGLDIRVGLDPLTVYQSSIVQVVGESRDGEGRGFRFELLAPVAERAYLTKEISLSSVTGSPLKGIPIPGTGITVDIDIGLRIRYGADIRTPDKLLIRAVRNAWYKTLEGYSVKQLYSDIGDPVLLEAFILHLLNNIANSIEDVTSEELPEIEVFVDGKASAGAGTASAGFCLSFVIKEPVRVIWDVIPWIIDNLRAFLLRMAHPGLPAGASSAPSTVLERIYVRGTVYSGIGLPGFLGGDEYGRATLGTVVEANIPALGALVGADRGRWMVRTGMMLPNLPSAVAAFIPGFDPPHPRCDLWLFQLSIMELDNDRAKLSEIYYDTKGFDPREEFVEIWNPTAKRIDVSRWVLMDQGGHWRLPDHLSIPPGGRMVIARNRDGFRALFNELPEVAGLTLGLNNDGDVMTLYDPWGVQIDLVAWKGAVHGWNLSCKNGQSLHRGPADTDTPKDWYCEAPDPGR